jgi:hypothetical protein
VGRELGTGHWALGTRSNEPDVLAGDHEKRQLLDSFWRVERRKRRVLDREELPIPLVHEVGQPAAVALARKRELALDTPAIRLENDLLEAKVQSAGMLLAASGDRSFRLFVTGICHPQSIQEASPCHLAE